MSSDSTNVSPSWPDYRTIWRWHFFAGLFCVPFVLALSVTGCAYLFKAEYEAWADQPYDRLILTGPQLQPSELVTRAVAALPGSTFRSFELPPTDHSAIRILLSNTEGTIRTYLHPTSGEVLHQVPEEERLMRVIHRLHGELALGDWGSHLVELAACWTVVMIVTGLCLWFPRHLRTAAGVLYPRLGATGRVFWRDLHSVTGFWISGAALLLIASGLPWASFWGDYLKLARKVSGTTSAERGWSNTKGKGMASDTGQQPAIDWAELDRVVATANRLKLAAPVLVLAGGAKWSVKSMTANRPYRTDVTVDGQTGDVIKQVSFGDKHPIDQAVAVGIAVHEGRLFGWPNQLLGLLSAMGLMLISLTGLLMWWRRRPHGTLGAPEVYVSPRRARWLRFFLGLMGVAMPLFGFSLVLVASFDKACQQLAPRWARWLGLGVTQSRTIPQE